MNTAMPGPVYLLLTNPSWGATEGYDAVIDGIKESWEFDPNETHAGVSVMGGLLLNWAKLDLEEEKLICVLELLLRAGANPSDALEQANMGKAKGKPYLAALNLLENVSLGKNLEESILGAKLQDIASQGLTVQDAYKKIALLLEEKEGWDTQINGMRVLSWFALSCCNEGKIAAGWPTPKDATTDNNVRKMRLLRHLAIASKSHELEDQTQRLLIGCGMLLLGSYFRSNGGELDASAALDKTAINVLGGAGDDGESLVDTLRATFAAETIDPVIKRQLAVGVVRGLAQVLVENQSTWSTIAMSIPFLYENGEFIAEGNTVGMLLHAGVDLPGPDFWEKLPHEDIYHDAMLRVAICSYPILSFKKEVKEARFQLLDQMEQWSSSVPLPTFDMSACKKWGGGNLFDNDEKIQDRLDQYAARFDVSQQAFSLTQSTQPAQRSTARSRL